MTRDHQRISSRAPGTIATEAIQSTARRSPRAAGLTQQHVEEWMTTAR
jgi:hypothetical protein